MIFFFIEGRQCLYCVSEFDGNVHFFSLELPRDTQQRLCIFKQLNDISVPFHINNIFYGSSDFSYYLNCIFFKIRALKLLTL